MGLYSRNKVTGRILEFQSSAARGTLVKNAISSGLAAEDVEEIEGSFEDFEAAQAADPTRVVEIEMQQELELIRRKEREILMQDAINRLKAEGVVLKHFGRG